MKKKQNLLVLALKGVGFISLPAVILFFSIKSFVFERNLVLSWVEFILLWVFSSWVLYFLVGIGFLTIWVYKNRTIELGVADFTEMEKLIRTLRWEIIEKSDADLIVRPKFDFPFRMVVDDTVTIKYSEDKVLIEGPWYYGKNIVEDIKGKRSVWVRITKRVVAFILLILLVSLPILDDPEIDWEISKIRHNRFIENVEVITINPPDVLGNSIANTNNHGIAVENDKHIFYVEYIEKFNSCNLIRVDKDFKNKKILLEKARGYSIERLNISGDWIYYTSKKQLNRISIDGDKDETIYKLGYLYNPHMKDNWIYYINFSDKSNVYKMDINGRNLERFLEIRTEDIAIYDDGMIFSHTEDERSYVESINLDGSDRRLEFTGRANDLIKFEEYYYYIGGDHGLYRRTIDGDIEPETLVDEKVLSYTIAENKIFYSLRFDDGDYPGRSIYKVGLDGTGDTIITDMVDTNVICKVGNWLLFNSRSDQNEVRLNRMNLLTDEIELIE